MSSSSRPLLLSPGPVEVSSASLQALARPAVHHRSPEFSDCLARVRELGQAVLQTKREFLILNCSGTGVMEAAVVNLLSPGERVLVVVSGKFGERWANMLEIFGMQVDRLQIPWGESVSLTQIQEAVQKNTYQAVYTQMCETSTGAYQPVEQIGSWLKANQPQVIFVVDGITGILTKPLDLEACGIDAIVCGSQKAFMLPTGLGFVLLSEKAKEACAKARCPRYYFDLRKELKAYHKQETAFSTAVNLFFALEQTLTEILELGVDHLYAEIQWRRKLCQQMMRGLGLPAFAKHPADFLTAIALPDTVDAKVLRRKIEKESRVTFMAGQDQLAHKILRIGHIGSLDRTTYRSALQAFVTHYAETVSLPATLSNQVLEEIQHYE